jgi:hypothetical protein
MEFIAEKGYTGVQLLNKKVIKLLEIGANSLYTTIRYKELTYIILAAGEFNG